jgi:hypothetical protein
LLNAGQHGAELEEAGEGRDAAGNLTGFTLRYTAGSGRGQVQATLGEGKPVANKPGLHRYPLAVKVEESVPQARATAVAADLPHDDRSDDPRPWEQAGAVRRHVAPHRSNLLMLLATVALVLGLSSFCLVVTGWAAIPLALPVRWLAQRDLERMTAGTMDPRGRHDAGRAQEVAGYAIALGFVGGLLCGLPLLTALLRGF